MRSAIRTRYKVNYNLPIYPYCCVVYELKSTKLIGNNLKKF